VIPLKDSNPTQRFPLVTILLIAANAVLFLYQMSLGEGGERFAKAFALVPARLLGGDGGPGTVPASVTVLTSMFLHGGPVHIAGNMLYLWIFGNNVEDSMGRVRFIVFYLLCGVAAALSHALPHPGSPVPLIGASGAVSGVLGAYLLLFPRARVVTLFFFGLFARMIEVPAMIVLGFWFVLQFLNALVSPAGGGGVAWFAHLGGFVAGAVLIVLFKRREVPFGGGRRSRSV
jgi:membrane associated rhomboid family serine protease